MAYTTIDDPSAHFQTALYTGDGASSKAIVNDGNSDLQPDWLWTKQRNASQNNLLFDSSRGVTKYLKSDENEAEATNAAFISSFNSDGFTLGNSTVVNDNNDTYVAWQWKANGGTTSSNTDGTITSTVQANTEAGFNILTYTGTGSNNTLGHGLGVVPKFVIHKRRSAVENWGAYHIVTGNTGCCFLNLTIAKSTAASYFNNTSPTSTTLSFGTNPAFNGNGSTHVAYCFAEIQGYSKIGTYTGNGSTNGTFVYLGFKVSWVMLKRTDSAASWLIFDNKRDIDNVVSHRVYANATDAEDSDTGSAIDFLSNGFKCRSSDSSTNTSSGTYIYMAFAENPFVSSEGVPTTAR